MNRETIVLVKVRIDIRSRQRSRENIVLVKVRKNYP